MEEAGVTIRLSLPAVSCFLLLSVSLLLHLLMHCRDPVPVDKGQWRVLCSRFLSRFLCFQDCIAGTPLLRHKRAVLSTSCFAVFLHWSIASVLNLSEHASDFVIMASVDLFNGHVTHCLIMSGMTGVAIALSLQAGCFGCGQVCGPWRESAAFSSTECT